MEQMHLLRTGHDHIADSRNRIHGNLMGNAVFDNLVALMAVQTAQEDVLRVIDHIADTGVLEGIPRLSVLTVRTFLREYLVNIDLTDCIEMRSHAVVMNQLVHVLHLIVDNYGRLGRIMVEIPLVAGIGPDDDDADLSAEHQQKHRYIRHAETQQPHHDIDKEIRDDRRQRLRINDIRDGTDLN